jgi:methylmalonyl-CoA mutase
MSDASPSIQPRGTPAGPGQSAAGAEPSASRASGEGGSKPGSAFGPEDLPLDLGVGWAPRAAGEARPVAPRTWLSLAPIGDVWPAAEGSLALESRAQREALLALLSQDLQGGADAIHFSLLSPGDGPTAGEAALLQALSQGDFGRWPLFLSGGRALLQAAPALAGRRGPVGFGTDPWRSADFGAMDWQRVAALPCAAGRPSIVLSSYRVEAAGASPELELTGLLLALESSLQGLGAAGLSSAAAGERIGFELALTCDVFSTIAKQRALRRVVEAWWGLFEPGFDPALAPLRGVSSQREFDVRDPWNNLLRSTYQAFGGVVGGADQIALLPLDQPLGRRGELGQRLARNLHTLLGEESHLGLVEDPALGSYALERRSEDLARAAWELYQRQRRQGGAAAWFGAGGQLEQELAALHTKRSQRLGSRRLTRIGVNDFVAREATPQAPGQTFERRTPPAGPARDGAAFEALARRAAGTDPAIVFLLNLGRQRDHHPRAAFMDALLAVAGIEARHGRGAGGRPPAEALEELCAEFLASGLPIGIVCGRDEDVRAALPGLLARLPRDRALYLAGRFEESEAWRSAGLAGGFHLGQDAQAFLSQLLTRLGR